MMRWLTDWQESVWFRSLLTTGVLILFFAPLLVTVKVQLKHTKRLAWHVRASATLEMDRPIEAGQVEEVLGFLETSPFDADTLCEKRSQYGKRIASNEFVVGAYPKKRIEVNGKDHSLPVWCGSVTQRPKALIDLPKGQAFGLVAVSLEQHKLLTQGVLVRFSRLPSAGSTTPDEPIRSTQTYSVLGLGPTQDGHVQVYVKPEGGQPSFEDKLVSGVWNVNVQTIAHRKALNLSK
jgi:hypothetical protein